ncbi:MAG: glutamate synthase [Candidatus Parabeggiatoa sp. nov. 3]|nr:MAG: glutamate synthase [Gammaproteobacteria bacterium]RKZ67589.1 MAG: glutamate synthase [Gammaproteobacteria bacterium]RKZ84777.1 MAG: glutamate synthase [Gammaproteobacteria bacterium]
MSETNLTFRLYKDNDSAPQRWSEAVIDNGESYICPTYIHRTPPCQASCPSGHDIRGWLSIVRGLDKPPKGMKWEEYAFQSMTKSNPFPAIMGRVCPAPCQDGCNRNEVENHVGINSVEQYIGDWAIENNLSFPKPAHETGKKVAVIGGGPAGLAAAYFLRLKGHSCTIFEGYDGLGGMMSFGIPGYRIPRDVLDHEVKRILDMGVEVKLKTRVGTDVTIDQLEKEYDAIFWGIGATTGKALPITGADAPNCVDGMAFLRAFNEGRLQHLSGRILVVGGGDTAMDVAAVARRIGHISQIHEKDRPENVILGNTIHDVATVARRQGADVWIVYRRPISKAPATKHELEAVISEGVEIHESLAPLEVILGEDGRAKALKVMPVTWKNGKMTPQEGKEYEIECTMIVGATGQKGDYTGIEELDNGWGLIDADKTYQVKSKVGHFVGGDAVKPHLLTTAIGHASIAVEGINAYLKGQDISPRPTVDSHHFSLLEELKIQNLEPETYPHGETWGTNHSNFAVHNYENRSFAEIISHKQLFLAHFKYDPLNPREEVKITTDEVLSNFNERFSGLTEEKAIAEAKRCMSCGMCFECDNCIIYCPQDAIFQVKKGQRAMGRYVETDYDKCVGCHICKDVCPTGYIQMGLGQ